MSTLTVTCIDQTQASKNVWWITSLTTDDQEKCTNQFIIMDSNFRKVDLIKTAWDFTYSESHQL